MKIQAWKNEEVPTYTVLIHEDFYEMSADANMPNGVNLYFGREEGISNGVFLTDKKEIMLGDLPKGTLIGIVRRLQNTLEEFIDYEEDFSHLDQNSHGKKSK